METEAHAHSIASPRHANEDRYRILDGRVPLVAAGDPWRGFLYAVADGVGGAPKGMKAAQTVCDRLTDFNRRVDLAPTEQGLLALLEEVNQEIHAWGLMEGADRPVGAAAATIAWYLPGGSLTLFHVGDTAAFVLDQERAIRLTRDHGTGRGLENYFGVGEGLRIQRIPVTACDEGDLLCLVSDGVTKACGLDHVFEAAGRWPSPKIAAERLVHAARRMGSEDDITVLAVEVHDWDILD